LVGPERSRKNVSSASKKTSPLTVTLTVWVSGSPGLKVRVPGEVIGT